jgi:hypothetical protein
MSAVSSEESPTLTMISAASGSSASDTSLKTVPIALDSFLAGITIDTRFLDQSSSVSSSYTALSFHAIARIVVQ